MKAIFRRDGDSLVPACQNAVEVMAQVGDRNEVLFDYKKGRSTQNHRRFFAFVNLTFDLQDQFDDPEVWRKYLEACAGHFHQAISPKTGQALIIVDSIAWDELEDENEFRELFNRVVQAFIDRYGHDISKEQLEMVVGF